MPTHFNSFSDIEILFHPLTQHHPTLAPILCRRYQIYVQIYTENTDLRHRNTPKFHYRQNEMLKRILDLDRNERQKRNEKKRKKERNEIAMKKWKKEMKLS